MAGDTSEGAARSAGRQQHRQVCGSAAPSSPGAPPGPPGPSPARPGPQEASARCRGLRPPEAHSQGARLRVPGRHPGSRRQRDGSIVREHGRGQPCAGLPPAPACCRQQRHPSDSATAFSDSAKYTRAYGKK